MASTTYVDPEDLERWCRIPVEELTSHATRIPFRIVADSAEMGRLMARDLADLIAARNAQGRSTRAIVPCGPSSWYEPFTQEVNTRGISLRELTVFHMDECLDWEGHPLPDGHPYNFRSITERHFYGGILP
jgi:glucosamine-6-phosphate deaminase